jgi:hypothetical protein
MGRAEKSQGDESGARRGNGSIERASIPRKNDKSPLVSGQPASHGATKHQENGDRIMKTKTNNSPKKPARRNIMRTALLTHVDENNYPEEILLVLNQTPPEAVPLRAAIMVLQGWSTPKKVAKHLGVSVADVKECVAAAPRDPDLWKQEIKSWVASMARNNRGIECLAIAVCVAVDAALYGYKED